MLRRVAHKFAAFFDKLLTTEHMSYQQIFSIIIPILIDQAFIIGMSMLNTAMISSSGVAAVSAVGMVDSLNIFLLNVFIAIATGGTVVVAQYKGNGNDIMVNKSISQTVTSVSILAISISVIVIVFHNPILDVLFGKAEQAVLDNARIYLIGSCISYVFIGVVEAVCGVLRGIAKSKPSMMLSLVMNFLYVGFNIVFIWVFKMGMFGMVLSMILSRLIAAIVSFIYLLKDESLCFKLKSLFIIDWQTQKKILYIGIPCAAEQLFFNGGKILTQTFIVQLGTNAIAVNTISNVITNLFQIGSNSLCLAVVTVVGQCMGRKAINDARKYVKSFLSLTSISSALVVVILLPLFPIIIKLFAPPTEIISTVFTVVAITGIGIPLLWPSSFIIPAAVRAAGDSKFTSIVSLLTMWLFRVVFGYVLGIILPFGIVGVWAAMIAEWGIRSIIFRLRLRGDKWCRHKLID